MGYPTGEIRNTNSTGRGWSPWFSVGESAALASSNAAPAITHTIVPLAATSTAGGYGAAVDDVQNVNALAGGSCSSTSTTTTTEWVTTTVSPAAGGAGGVSYSWATTSPADAPAAASVSTSDSVSLVVTSSVAAGGFYQVSVPTTFATSPMGSSAAASSMYSSAASSAAVPSSTGSTGGSTGGKRGLSFNDASLTSAFAGTGMTWAYNWGNSPQGSILSGLEFVPMLWGLQSTPGWADAAKAAIASGSTHLLSFNEPDFSTQSNIDPATAATNHQNYMNQFAGNGVQIGSPAITNAVGTSPPQGIDWLNQFFTACAGNCKVDFVAFHWYAPASTISYFMQHVQDVINAAAANGVSKVWLTEFQAAGSDSEVEAFLAEALPFLDSTPAVERYAYFMCATGSGNLVSSNSLSAIGQAYAA
jgi:hypothetical protein